MKIPDKNQALIDLAMKFVGVHENEPDDLEIIKTFQSIISKPVNQPWCVDFVQYCVREIDKSFGTKTILFPTESAFMLWQKTPAIARVQVPEPGCIMVWEHFNGDTPTPLGHAGIVRELVDSGYVLTCEGNTTPGPGIDREGDGVYLKRRQIKVTTGNMRTLGFLLPWAN